MAIVDTYALKKLGLGLNKHPCLKIALRKGCFRLFIIDKFYLIFFISLKCNAL